MDPTPAPGEVAIDVEASGVNFADCVIRMGFYESQRKLVGWPITPGIRGFGPRIRGGSGGRPRVTRFGGYASRVFVPESQVFPLPPRLDVHQAAGFPVIFLTAYYASYMVEAKEHFYRNRDQQIIPERLRRMYEERLHVIKNYSGRTGAFLDVGCGLGMFLRLAREQGFSVTGVEPDRYPVTNAEYLTFLRSANYRPKDTANFLRHWSGGHPP